MSNTWTKRNCGDDGKVKPHEARHLNNYKLYKERFLNKFRNFDDIKFNKHLERVMSCWCRGDTQLHLKQQGDFQVCNLPVDEEEEK